ncbi:MAG: DNA polymerase III subunit gamma/tau [Marinilabiliales bacterium]|nr:MAG: DNA polymerase III subunit gamma/tau [Marinilabiliales bacterium]
MENYIVSARKYRPETFQTVIGQPSITTTLKNAIKSRQLAHAYLFCGPRGVGKTTCARIFAKTINCPDLTPDIEACNKCESCLAFNSSRSFNIHELDAASNNSVDDIRTLIEQVRIPPQVGKYSIYIIDEVHMLSSQAFNAFLKTLEEPPPHAIFILATTEKHKILPTILSRCQIFDFNRIRVEDIVVHLEAIASAENIVAETEALNVISQKADGAMRDALSIFDQIAGFSEGKITYSNVLSNLNVLDYDYYFRLTEAILAADIPAALMIFNEVLDKGFDGHNFVNGLSRHFRDLLVCQDQVTLQLLEVGASIREKYREQSAKCPPVLLVRALDITNQYDVSFRSSKNQRLHVELCLIKLCSLKAAEKKKSEPGTDNLKRGKSAEKEASAGSEVPTEKGVPAEKEVSTEKGVPAEKELSAEKEVSAQKEVSAEKAAKKPAATAATATPDIKDQEAQGAPPANPHAPPTATSLPNTEQAEKGEVPGIGSTQTEKGGVPGIGSTQTPANGPGNANGTTSIKDVLRGGVTAPADEQEEEIPGLVADDEEDQSDTDDGDDFTEKELTEQWKKFANQIRNRHPRLYNTLLANKPAITGRNSIEFEISNPLQEEALNKIIPDLIKHLRRELNKNIELKVIINEELQGSRLYLPEDKFGHMVKKNPDLALLRQKFNLDFE